MFHRLSDKGDNSLTEIPGCPEKRIIIQSKRGNSNIIYNVHVSTMLREINKTICSIWKLVSLLLKGNLERET